MGLLPAVTPNNPLVPEGISHEVDLSSMLPEQRQLHHAKQLREIGFYQGKNGVDEYRRLHPDAKPLVELTSLAYIPKPAGYPDALAAIVDHWFISDIALAATNSDDVARLNAKLRTDRFNPRNHFSKPLSAAILQRLACVFDRHKAVLPAAAKTMTAVRSAVRSFKARGTPDAQLVGKAGTRVGDTLTIGARAFTVSRNGSRECIWLTGEHKRRLYVDDIIAIADLLAGGGAAGCSDYLLCNKIRDRHYSLETAAPTPPTEDVSERSALNPASVESAPGDRHYSLADMQPDPSLTDRLTAIKTARLAAEAEARDRIAAAHDAASAAGRDILDL